MADTINRGYPKPVVSHLVSEDVLLLMQTFDLVDADIGSILLALNGKAAVGHTHGMDDISGLTNALEGKAPVGHTHAFDSIEGVSGTASAPDGYVLAKVAGIWVPQSPASLLGAHKHSIDDITNLQSALNSKLDAANLATLSLKSAIADADTFIGLDSVAQNAPKRYSWAAIKNGLKSVFDAIYAPINHGHAMSAISGLVEALAAKAALNALPITKSFDSGQQAITSGAFLAIPHNLGVKPKIVQIAIACVANEAEYVAATDEIPIPFGPLMAADRGVTINPDETNINLRYGANANVMYAMSKSTGQGVALTNAKWRLIVRAFA